MATRSLPSLRLQALLAFKKLHRTSRMIFEGDNSTLTEARNKINAEFKERKALTEPEKIIKAIKMAEEAELTLRLTVVQAELKDPDSQIFRVKVNPDTLRNENAKLKVGDVPGNIRDDN